MRAALILFLIFPFISCNIISTFNVFNSNFKLNEHQQLPDDGSASWNLRLLPNNDFEDGNISPWYDESVANVFWGIEDYNNPSGYDSQSPEPINGTRYLRAIRNPSLLSGLAVLRSEPFIASPGDTVSFNFWIRSRRPEGNNLELVMVTGRNETVLVSLSRFSTASNYEWRDVDPPVSIPVTTPTTIELVFYAYCGSDDEDAVAVDDIVVKSADTPPNPPPSTCNGTFTGSTGLITSPNYPGNYNNSLDCRYFIDVGSSRTRLTFTDFQLENGFDYVEVYDGWSTTNTRLLRVTCSSTCTLPSPVTASSNLMLVRFSSDGSDNYRGFSANYDRVA